MKKIRYGCLGILCALMVMGLTACGSRDTGMSSSADTGTDRTVTESTEKGSTGADMSSESTGVIDGLLDDVEEGVDKGMDDLKETTSGSTTGSGKMTTGADE